LRGARARRAGDAAACRRVPRRPHAGRACRSRRLFVGRALARSRPTAMAGTWQTGRRVTILTVEASIMTHATTLLDEPRDPLTVAEEWLDEGRNVAIATVVETWGSAPRPA